MSCSTRVKSTIAAILVSAMIIAAPLTDFNVKSLAADDEATNTNQINDDVKNDQTHTEVSIAIGASIDFDASLDRAIVIDLANESVQSQVEQAQIEAEKALKEAEEAARKAEEEKRINDIEEFRSNQLSRGFLITTDKADLDYCGRVVSLSEEDRSILEHLVMGEAGNQGFVGAALVAQTIRDRLVYDGFNSVESVRVSCGYEGSLNNTPNSDVLAAVSFIFDQGGSAVQHTVRYFYAYTWSSSAWHETMSHICTYGDHKFFDRY